jgi:hypothetical protein
MLLLILKYYYRIEIKEFEMPGHVARKGEEVNVYNSDAGELPRRKHTTNVYNLWIRKPEWKRPLEKRGYRSEDNVT